MTTSPIRCRPRHAKARIRVRVAQAVLGAVVGSGWLVLPVMTVGARDAVPLAAPGPVASAAAAQQDETSTADLVLPLVAGGAAVALAGYGYLRRTRRARSRTTPGIVSVRPPTPAPADSERQARAALVLADDCVRTSREELSFVRERFGEEEAEPFTHAVRAAETELSAAFAIWRRYEEGTPAEPDARRQALVGVIGRCAEAGRRLDAETPALDGLRGLERGLGGALEVAEGRFRELTARATAAQGTLSALHERYPPLAGGSVTGYVEQAKDRLVFATAHLNRARQADGSGKEERAAGHLRAAEGAVAQAGTLVDAVERLADRLRQAAVLVPPALKEAEARLRKVRHAEVGPAEETAPESKPGEEEVAVSAGQVWASPAAGELHARLAHADVVLAAVRAETTGGPYDPLDALRRITRALARLGAGRSGVLNTAALLVAGGSVTAAEEFVSVHRGAVGAEARARLAQAVRSLAAEDAEDADTVSRQARELAERDVRTHGNPYAGTDGDSADLAGAVLGGILLAEDPDGGPPTSFGGPGTRARHRFRPAT
ncbi:hypothetical protein ACGFT2_12890 [Streptomyces sp. NPDC048514]|uniref:hypothetical protein n=1 Tax=Streptomyces sp. NPDC048514 TaxID=3365564 RepID=UPI00371DEA36